MSKVDELSSISTGSPASLQDTDLVYVYRQGSPDADYKATAEEVREGILGDPANSLADPSVKHFIERTSSPNAGVQAAFHVQHKTSFLNTQVGVGSLMDIIDDGSASGGTAHLVGGIGRATNGTGGAIPCWGLEGKVVIEGTATNDNHPFLGIYQRNSDTPLDTGAINIYSGFPELTAADGSTPDNTGEVVYFNATFSGTGGDPAKIFALKGRLGAKIITGGSITSTDSSTGASSCSMYHDGSSSYIVNTGGNFVLEANGILIVGNATSSFAPLTPNTPLGIPSNRWGAQLSNVNIVSTSVPSSSSDTGTAGDIAFDADYMYRCVATNTWKRAAFSTW